MTVNIGFSLDYTQYDMKFRIIIVVTERARIYCLSDIKMLSCIFSLQYCLELFISGDYR